MQQISILGKLAAVFIAIPATICLAYWLFVRRDDGQYTINGTVIRSKTFKYLIYCGEICVHSDTILQH